MKAKDLVVSLEEEVDAMADCGGRTTPPGAVKPADLEDLKNHLRKVQAKLDKLPQ